MIATTVARWESKTGKHWVSLYEDSYGFSYDSPGMTGSIGRVTRDEAIASLEARLFVFQPDANTTKMHRVI